MKYTQARFSVGVGSSSYRDNWDRMFGKGPSICECAIPRASWTFCTECGHLLKCADEDLVALTAERPAGETSRQADYEFLPNAPVVWQRVLVQCSCCSKPPAVRVWKAIGVKTDGVFLHGALELEDGDLPASIRLRIETAEDHDNIFVTVIGKPA